MQQGDLVIQLGGYVVDKTMTGLPVTHSERQARGQKHSTSHGDTNHKLQNLPNRKGRDGKRHSKHAGHNDVPLLVKVGNLQLHWQAELLQPNPYCVHPPTHGQAAIKHSQLAKAPLDAILNRNNTS